MSQADHGVRRCGRGPLLAVLVIGAMAGAPASADAARTLAISDASVTEPDGTATTIAAFPVKLSKKAKRTVKFDYQTNPVTADADVDFEDTTGTGKIGRNKKKTTVSVTIYGDDSDENNETFIVALSNVRGATPADTTATGTITDNDEPEAPPALAALTRIGVADCVDLGLTNSPVATVVLDRAAAGDTFVTVTSTDPNVASVSGGGVTVSSGQTTVQVPVTTGPNEGTTQLIADLAGHDFALTIAVHDDCPDAHPVLNEVDYDTPGATEDLEFVEIYNSGSDSIDLTNVALILFDGTTAQQATEYGRYALSSAGTLDPGEFLVVKDTDVGVPGGVSTVALPGASDDVQNGPRDGMALFNTTDKTVYDALSYEKDNTGGAITEALATGYAYPLDLTEGGTPTSAEDNNSTPASLARSPNGVDTNQPNTDWTVATTATRGSANATAVLNETDFAQEADFCNVQFPSSLNVQAGQSTPQVFGQISEAGVTGADGPGGLAAQVGYGPQASDPRGNSAWTWTSAPYSSDIDPGENEEYGTAFAAASTPGTYLYAYRFSLDGGGGWTYCDLNGAGSGSGLTFEQNQLPTMTVTP